jgi:hypothetical protein
MNSPLRAIVWGGFWCGVLDIMSAIVAWRIYAGVSAIRIFQSVAGGWLGRPAAVQGGWKTAVLGIFSHFMIAFGAAVLYYLASRKIAFLRDQAVVSGLIYGELVFLFMNVVVLPLSALHTQPFGWTAFSPWPTLITGPIGHPFFVGLPIALAVRRYATGNR